MYYLDWKLGKDIDGLEPLKFDRLLTEVDENGRVLKEIGLDLDGNIKHACPAEGFKYGTYGLFDNVLIEKQSLRNDLIKDEFYSIWNEIEKFRTNP